MDNSVVSPQPTRPGLAPEVKDALLALLSSMVPAWLGEVPLDHRRVPRPTGPGGFSIQVEPYKGLQSWMSYRKKHAEGSALTQIAALIRERQPELLGYVRMANGTQMRIQDSFALCAPLAEQAALRLPQLQSTEEAVSHVVADLDNLLATREAEREVMSLLVGLELPAGTDSIALDAGLYIRRLSPEEISHLGSTDILDEPAFSLTSRRVTSALISVAPTRITLSEHYDNSAADHSEHQIHQQHVDRLLAALHSLKSGRVGVLASIITIRPSVLPHLNGHSQVPHLVSPFCNMALTEEDLGRVVGLYRSLSAPPRAQVTIAAARLVDAEHRLSPVDALLDSVIGLEVLFNPNDRAELAFRVALNYAYLAAPPERRRRYEAVKEAQATRNRVVHGGLNNLQPQDAALLHSQAEAAKACLRDAIERFLTDASLAGSRKLDADFWLDRVLPPGITE